MSLDVRRVGPSWFATNGVAVLEFAQIHESGATFSAEVTATCASTGLQYWARLNLAAPRSRGELAKALCESVPGPSWMPMLDEACQRVVLEIRSGAPTIPLRATKPSPARWLVPGLIPAGETTILYGDGGTMKSLLALALAWSGLGGKQVSPQWAMPRLSSVLYLDWESRAEEHEGRWWGLSRGVGIEPPEGLHYLAMERTLTDSLGHIQRAQAEAGAELVIVDSLAPACGAEPEGSDAAVRTLSAMRSIPATRLVLAHVSKAAADMTGPTRPFGSVFVRNLARSTVEAKLADEVDESAPSLVTYHHTKSNTGRKQPPFALSWIFTESGYIAVEQGQADRTHAPIPTRILHVLQSGSKSAPSIAEELGISPNQVRSALDRLESAARVVRLSDFEAGRGKKGMWGLRDAKRTI